MDLLQRAIEVFEIEIETLKSIQSTLDKSILEVINYINNATGKVILIGIGKSGHISRKIAATMSSMGTPSFYVHPGEACHGDLGMIEGEDIVILISNSGETEEVINLLPSIRKIGAKIISISSDHKSTLAKNADYSVEIKVSKEACYMNIAPTSSTTAVLVYGDALAICLAEQKGFKKDDFGVFHPKGSIGRRLLTRVSDLMSSNDKNPIVYFDDSLHEVLSIMSNKASGIVNVVDYDNKLKGIITGGDLIRFIEKNSYSKSKKASELMNNNPVTIKADLLAITALEQIRKSTKKLVVLPVVDDDGICVGTISVNDLVRANLE